MITAETSEGQAYFEFRLFGVRVPRWLYGTVGPYVPYRFRSVDWQSRQVQSGGDGSVNLQVGGDFHSADRG